MRDVGRGTREKLVQEVTSTLVYMYESVKPSPSLVLKIISILLCGST